MTAQATSSPLTGERLARYHHACAFFTRSEEEYQALGPFIREGLALGEKSIHITDPKLRADYLDGLEATGVDVGRATETGQLEVLSWDESYLRGGRFSPSEMLELLTSAIRLSRTEGYPRTRIIGHMEWALEDRPGVDQLLEYEARVNFVLSKERQLAVCAYDLKQIGAATMMDVLRTHPMVVIGGALYENPFFVPPDEFLEELAGRSRSTTEV